MLNLFPSITCSRKVRHYEAIHYTVDKGGKLSYSMDLGHESSGSMSMKDQPSFRFGDPDSISKKENRMVGDPFLFVDNKTCFPVNVVLVLLMKCVVRIEQQCTRLLFLWENNAQLLTTDIHGAIATWSAQPTSVRTNHFFQCEMGLFHVPSEF